MNNAKVIDIHDIITYLKHKKKKYFLFVFIIGFIVGGTFNVISTSRNKSASANNSEQSNLEAARATLSEEKASQTESVYKNYILFQNSLDTINSSSILSTNSKTGVQNVLTYYIESKNNSNSVAQAIKSMFFDEKLTSNINNQLKTKIDDETLKQFINFDIKESKTNKNNNEGSNNSNVVFSITIFAKNKSQLSIITSNSTKQVNELVKKLIKLNSSIKCQLLGTSVSKISESDVLDLRSSLANRITDITTAMNNLKNLLDSNQQSYFDLLLSQSKSTKTTTAKQTSSGVSIIQVCKYAFSLAILFEIIYLLIVVVSYVLSNKLHSTNEVHDLLHLNIISLVKNKDDINNAINELDYYLNGKKESTALSTSLESPNLLDQMKVLSNECSLKVINSYPVTKKDYDELTKLNNVILVEKIGASNTKEIKKLIEYYQAKHIDIKYVILFE